MNTMISGAGADVLFLHGGGVAGWMWGPVIEHLGTGVRSIVPDLPGHGTSVEVPYVSHADAVGRIAALLMDRAPHGATVVGFSLGGQLALELAARHPELVRSLLVVSAETIPAPAQGVTLALLKASAPLARQEWFARAQAKQLGVPHELLDRYVADSRALGTDSLVASVAENIAYTIPVGLERFAGPAIVAVGAKERRLMRDSATVTLRNLEQRIGAHSELVTIPGAAHDAPFSHPELVADMVRSLLRLVDIADAEAFIAGIDD